VTDQFSSKKRSWIMRQIRSTDTGPELVVRRLSHRMGYRYCLHRKDLPGCPDIVFPKRSSIIFVNGCFWHGHSCKRARLPATRREYWSAKTCRNAQRDRTHRRQLNRLGWSVLTIWECQLKDHHKLQERIAAFLHPRTKRN
jgi:DNA mismatch endonuclease, patch repair protein